MKRTVFTFILFWHISYAASITQGVVEDAQTDAFIPDVLVCDAKRCVQSDENGYFYLQTESNDLHIKAYGYRPYSFRADTSSKIHRLEPIKIQALYLTFWGASPHTKTYRRVMKIIDTTSVNSVVVDLKNEYGDILYPLDSPQAKRYGALKNVRVRDIKSFVRRFKDKGVYLIGRIVVFKDERQAANNEYTIKRNGRVWRNHDNLAWVDPFDTRAWKYALDLAEDAAKKGFDEINFDYIRFPARSGIELAKENTMQNRTQTIGAFLEYAQARLRPYGVFISVDTFGNICWSDDDSNIGQTIEVFARHADYLCPMVYPSSFASGSFGKKYPSEHPYEVIFKSIDNIKDRIDLRRVRPWIQAFKDYTPRKLPYDDFEIQEQIRATEVLKTNGWMMWSPSSRYKLGYFRPILSRDVMASSRRPRQPLPLLEKTLRQD